MSKNTNIVRVPLSMGKFFRYWFEECGSTDIKEAHISEWETKYEEKYKQNYLKATKKIKK